VRRSSSPTTPIGRSLPLLSFETAPARHGPSPRLQIGHHAGPAIVGNVGFPGRIDHTLVGDTVNIAERIQSGLRGIERAADIVIPASEAVFARRTPTEVDACRAIPWSACTRTSSLRDAKTRYVALQHRAWC